MGSFGTIWKALAFIVRVMRFVIGSPTVSLTVFKSLAKILSAFFRLSLSIIFETVL